MTNPDELLSDDVSQTQFFQSGAASPCSALPPAPAPATVTNGTSIDLNERLRQSASPVTQLNGDDHLLQPVTNGDNHLQQPITNGDSHLLHTTPDLKHEQPRTPANNKHRGHVEVAADDSQHRPQAGRPFGESATTVTCQEGQLLTDGRPVAAVEHPEQLLPDGRPAAAVEHPEQLLPDGRPAAANEQPQQLLLGAELPSLDSYLPEFGFKVPLDHTFPKKWDPYFVPKPAQAVPFIPLCARYLKHYVQLKLKDRRPVIDQLRPVESKMMYGVPLGGIGSGTIGRGFKGEFCRFHLVPGHSDYNTVAADQFLVSVAGPGGDNLYQKVLAPAGRGKTRPLSGWDWPPAPGEGAGGVLEGRYCGLYPRSWTVYDLPQQRIRLVLRQVSPVIPHDYKDSCLPVGVFVWTVENYNTSPRRVSVALTCQSGTGAPLNKNGGECWSESVSAAGHTSVLLHHTQRRRAVTYCLAAANNDGVTTSSVCQGFDPNSDGSQLWAALKATGHLNNSSYNVSSSSSSNKKRSSRGSTGNGPRELAVAVCSAALVPAGGTASLQLALAWDAPSVSFRSNERTYNRRYSRWFSGPHAAANIAGHALANYSDWEQRIHAWQSTVLSDRELPPWFKSALFNQLYYVADGGSLWLDLPEDEAAALPAHDPRHEYGRFAYLESHEYRMYNTYDVHYYASWALAMLWPQLQRVMQYDIASYTMAGDNQPTKFLFSGHTGTRKTPSTVPHDVGDPDDEPFVRINSYTMHDVKDWKDLNLKFVLQVHRDYTLFDHDRVYLAAMWPVCCSVMEVSQSFDRDEDGLIENDGAPDQTFDSWIMHGPSAYCTSLWLSALCAMEAMAGVMKETELQQRYRQLLDKAILAHTSKLWNGSYFNFDSCSGKHSRSIMADQLSGHWYLTLTGEHRQVLDPEHVRTTLRTIYENNVLKFCDGKMGAVNGMLPDGKIDSFTIQSEEMWTGVTFALAATMIKEGMVKEGFHTAEGLYRTVHEEIGLAYEMPESLFASGHYRAIGYMRPLSVWSMYRAWCLRKEGTQQGAEPAKDKDAASSA